jgi:hypothetical protein
LQKEHKKTDRIKKRSQGEPTKRSRMTTGTENTISPPSGEDKPKKEIDDEMVPEEIDTHFKLFGKHAWEVP